MISKETFDEIVRLLGEQGDEDIEWSENIIPPTDADDFALEAIFVICNSGMKNTIARAIFERVTSELYAGGSAHNKFGHSGKASAIDEIWADRDALFGKYLVASDKVEFCASLPWIGGITKYHLAKNFGAQVAKPDVHLQRLADHEKTTAQELCERLARDTGLKVATVDVVLWRACANGILNSRTGKLQRAVNGND
jgi:hypothetical protein